jgi:hypothetical protein
VASNIHRAGREAVFSVVNLSVEMWAVERLVEKVEKLSKRT